MPWGATQDGCVIVESSDKTWSTGEGDNNYFSILALNGMKRQKDMTLKDELPRSVQFSSVQSLSRVQLFATPWIAARQASLSITTSRSSLRLTSIESVMPFSHLILYRPLLLLWRNSSRRNEEAEPKWKQCLLDGLVVKVQSDAIKSNIA